MSVTDDISRLYARIDDLCGRADRGEIGISDFLSPRELHFAESYLARKGVNAVSYGGYGGAERKRIYVLPDYMEDVNHVSQLSDFGHSVCIAALEVKSAGYRRLTHRDYLGAVLGLGIERAVIGDILVVGEDGGGAVIFCDEPLAFFLSTELVKIASEKVRCSIADLDGIAVPERRTAAINDTVASPRIDCVVGALCSFSREKSREAVVSGLVEIDFETEQRPDRLIHAPCMISVRNVGRFCVVSVEDKTKKGRYRLVAEKFL